MEIIVGSMQPIGPPVQKDTVREKRGIEARLLHVRPPRRGIAGPSGAERRGKKTKDPVKGKVLTLMVLDGDELPKDLDKVQYMVSLRFHKR